MSAQICTECGVCYGWAERYKHECKEEDIKEEKEWQERKK